MGWRSRAWKVDTANQVTDTGLHLCPVNTSSENSPGKIVARKWREMVEQHLLQKFLKLLPRFILTVEALYSVPHVRVDEGVHIRHIQYGYAGWFPHPQDPNLHRVHLHHP